MDAVVTESMMRVLLTVCDVSMLRECEGGVSAVVGTGGGVVAVNEYMGRTRGSGVVSSAYDLLEMSGVVRAGGVCEMCMYLARGG